MKHFLSVVCIILSCFSCVSCQNEPKEISPEDSSGFVVVTDVVPDAILEIRYYSTYNFIGDRIPGYLEPIAILTREAADSLKVVSDELLKQGYRLKIFDAYRPQCAVDYFMKWTEDTTDIRMKEYFYPELDKSVIVPQEYVARRSGHTRGSTIDLTLFDMKTEKEVDMGCTYDYFGVASHPDVKPGQEIGAYKPISEEQYRNRMILRHAMLSHGFKPYDCEWVDEYIASLIHGNKENTELVSAEGEASHFKYIAYYITIVSYLQKMGLTPNVILYSDEEEAKPAKKTATKKKSKKQPEPEEDDEDDEDEDEDEDDDEEEEEPAPKSKKSSKKAPDKKAAKSSKKSKKDEEDDWEEDDD